MTRGLFALGFSLLSLALGAQERPPAVVEVAVVEARPIAPTIWVPGTVISRQDSNIASEVTGVLKTVLDVGDRVQQGAVLARVNDRQLRLQLARDRADLARLEAKLVFAQKQLERTRRLSASNSTAEFRTDELQMERDVLRQEITLAKVKIADTEYSLERSQILAPFDGVVVARFHQPGEHIASGEELLRLVNTARLEISARAPVDVSRFVRRGQAITIKSAAREQRSTVRSLVPVGDPQSRMLEVRVQLQGDWVVGDAVSISLDRGEKAVTTVVPRDALVFRSDEVYVYRVNSGKAEKIAVLPGVGDAGDIAVDGSLAAGDLIVTRGAERLENGSTVEILNEIAGH